MSRRSRLSLSERIEIIKWHASYQNAAEVARQFHYRYGRTPPHCKKKHRIINLLRVYESATYNKPFFTVYECYKPFHIPLETRQMEGFITLINPKRVCYTLHFHKPS